MYLSQVKGDLSGKGKPNLIFFPPAGTLASSVLRLLATSEIGNFPIFVFDYPGRGVAHHLLPAKKFEDLCMQLYLGLQPLLNSSVVLLGHSFGGYVALEVARMLRFRQRIDPLALILSGVKSLSQINPQSFPQLLELENDVLLDTIGITIPPSYAEMRSSIIDWIRNDVALLNQYKPKFSTCASSMFIINGDNDPHTASRNGIDKWQPLSEKSCKYFNINAQHAFNEAYVESISQCVLSISE